MTKKKRIKSPEISLLSRIIPGFIIGFGLGYAAKDYDNFSLKNLSPQPLATLPLPNQHIAVCFTPARQCQAQIITEINRAKKSIHVQAYSFTDKMIAQSLVNAQKRGVDVKVLLDRSNRTHPHSLQKLLTQNHIPLRFDAPSGIAHNKIIIIDQQTLIGGSYNYSAAAYKNNTDNVMIINNSELAQKYLENWQKRWEVSLPLSVFPLGQKQGTGVSNKHKLKR